jgi:hypothetical protein
MAKNSGPGQSTRKGQSASGRAIPKGSPKANANVGRYTDAEAGGRYTKPIPKEVKVSPSWYGPVILALLILGVLIILLNYLAVFGTPSGWLLILGLVVIGAGFVLATRYR